MKEPTPAGQGRLAQVIATRGGRAAPEAPFLIEHREALIYMLCEAAELEHAIMCQYLYAAFSLKQDADEGLRQNELSTVVEWRKTVGHIATQEMLHLALVENLLAAIGAAPHLTRPNLPQPAGHYPPGVVLALMPFGEAALQHFMFLERPEGMDIDDAPGLAAVDRAAPVMQEGEIVPRLQDFATVGHLYRSIEEGIRHLCDKYGEPWLFVGPPEAQAIPEHFNWPDLVRVTDSASAQRAIDTILDQGEGPRGHWRRAHFGRFVEILDEYQRLKRANPSFEPARPVLPATVRPSPGNPDAPLIADEFTAKCTDLFNVSYEVLLLILQRYFAHTEETEEQLAALAQVTLGLMFNVIKPLGELVTRLPVGEFAPGRSAGPSFELFYESDCLLPHRDAAWALVEERIREAAAFADRLGNDAPSETSPLLEPIGPALLDLAHTLAAHRADWGGADHTGEVTVEHRRRYAESARANPDVGGRVDRLGSALERAFQAEHALALAALLATASLRRDAATGEDTQAEQMRTWTRGLTVDAYSHFDQVLDLADLVVGVRGATRLSTSDFPYPAAPATSGSWVATIEQLVPENNGLGEEYERLPSYVLDIPAAALLLDPRPSPKESAAQTAPALPAMVDQASVLALVDRITKRHAEAEGAISSSHGGPSSSSETPSVPQIFRELSSQPLSDTRAAGPPRRDDSQTAALDRGLHLAQLFYEAHCALVATLGLGVCTEHDPVMARQRLRDISNRLYRRVLRPLASALVDLPAWADLLTSASRSRSNQPTGAVAERLRDLALRASKARTDFAAAPPELLEATAALQDLAVRYGGQNEVERSRLLEQLRTMESSLGRSIQLVHDGPYVLTNVEHLTDGLGQPITSHPEMALCRCGESGDKPWCDGSHAAADFTDAKDPKRLSDRRDTYDGLAITVFDNRGICQHSGFCTDRIATAFRADQEPFVAPSGARMDEIIRAVRDCPSGALSFAIDGTEARDTVDWHQRRPPMIMVTKNGPYRVTGGVPLVDPTGDEVARNQGSSLEHYALCRCGHSQNKPFCSGMHWYIDFHDPLPDPGRRLTLFEWCGGLPALTRATRLFFGRYVPEDPLLASLFATAPFDLPERVAAWLGEVLGGPPLYQDQYGDEAHLLGRYAGQAISEEQGTQWVGLLSRAARETGLADDPDFWSSFVACLEWASKRAVQISQPGVTAEPGTQTPRWDWGPTGPPGVAEAVHDDTVEQDAGIAMPKEGEDVSFGAHIKPMFRERDRQSMTFAFDLWSYDDVKEHSQDIVNRLRAGTMPCDGAWAQEKTDLFQRWIDSGMPA